MRLVTSRGPRAGEGEDPESGADDSRADGGGQTGANTAMGGEYGVIEEKHNSLTFITSWFAPLEFSGEQKDCLVWFCRFDIVSWNILSLGPFGGQVFNALLEQVFRI